MLFDEELEAVENNPIIKDLIELNIIENTDNLSFFRLFVIMAFNKRRKLLG